MTEILTGGRCTMTVGSEAYEGGHWVAIPVDLASGHFAAAILLDLETFRHLVGEAGQVELYGSNMRTWSAKVRFAGEGDDREQALRPVRLDRFTQLSP